MKYFLILLLFTPQLAQAGIKIKPNVKRAIEQAAEANHISSRLLTALCFKESSGRPWVIKQNDPAKPSYGLCQLKEQTAIDMGFKGQVKDLLNPFVNAYYAAKYLRYQLDRYDQDWLDAVSAYNAGSAYEVMINKQYVRDVLRLAVEI